MKENKSITKSAGIIGSATFISRIFGFLRDVIIAAFFGTGMYAQAFVVAFRIPNMLRSIVGEGTSNAVIVPVLSEAITKRDKEDFWNLVGNLINIIFFSLIIISGLGVLFAPFIIRIIAPGFLQNADKFILTVRLTRIVFPYIFFIGLTSIIVGILNSFRYFTIPAFSQVVFNVLFIISVLILYFVFHFGIYSLAIAVLVGGVGQLAMQIPSLYKYGFRPYKKIFSIHPAMKRMGKLFIPRLMGAGVYHINILVDTMLASLAYIVGKGGVAALYYSNRLIQLPLAIFGISLAQASLPTFSRQSLENDLSKFKNTVSSSLENVFFITVPSIIGLIILREPIIRSLFERGSFDAYSTRITSYTLLFYAFGLFSYSGIKILVSSFYSLKDTFTPVKVASFSVLLNIILNLVLMHPLKIGGLALATSISATFNFFLLYYMLMRKIGRIFNKVVYMKFLKSAFASFVMGVFCYLFFYKVYMIIMGDGFIKECIGIFLTVVLSFLVYLFVAKLMNMSEPKRIMKFLLRLVKK